MKNALLIAALVIAAGSVIFWAAAGANRGWTKTSVPKKIVDEVTGIEGVRYEKRFVPGVDFLAVTLGGAAVLAGISLVLRKKPGKLPNQK